MGNTDIALPTEKSHRHAVSTQQESRSVLGKEVEINPSSPPIKILYNDGPQANVPTWEPVCACAHTCNPVCASASARNTGMHEPHISPDQTKGKRTAKATPELRWADVARKGQTRDIKGMVIPTLFTKFKLDKCLFIVSMNTLTPKVAKESARSTSVEIQQLYTLQVGFPG
jgi:hypothetical protein